MPTKINATCVSDPKWKIEYSIFHTRVICAANELRVQRFHARNATRRSFDAVPQRFGEVETTKPQALKACGFVCYNFVTLLDTDGFHFVQNIGAMRHNMNIFVDETHYTVFVDKNTHA